MRITFIGLSCFLIESTRGERLLLEPYYGDPIYGLGLKFPDDLQADVFLASHPDEDHSFLRHSMIRQRTNPDQQDRESDIDIFPDFNLRGTLVREYNGDACIAFSFTVDGIRCVHLADNAHILSQRQLLEIGNVDIVFVPMPKGDHNVAADVIRQFQPKIAIPSHYIPVLSGVDKPQHDAIASEIHELFTADWMKDANNNDFTQGVFVKLFENALNLCDEFEDYQEIQGMSFEVNSESLPSQTAIKIFRDCLGMQVTK